MSEINLTKKVSVEVESEEMTVEENATRTSDSPLKNETLKTDLLNTNNGTDSGNDNNTNIIKDNNVNNNSNNINNTIRRPRKKRKTFSCDICRKVKTRCDFDNNAGKCHRCNMLNINCSLNNDNIIENISNGNNTVLPSITLPKLIPNMNKTVELPPLTNYSTRMEVGTDEMVERLKKVEENINGLNTKMELILLLLQENNKSSNVNNKNVATTTSTSNNNTSDNNPNKVPPKRKSEELTATNLLRQPSNGSHSTSGSSIGYNSYQHFERIKVKEYPYKILNVIDERLFPTKATSKQEAIEREQRPSAVARVNFLQFYEDHQQLCHELAKEFLTRSHFWIIPGGIKEINSEYARNHLFITSVFTIIAMSSSDNDQYAKEQEILYPLVERLLTNTLTMFEKLTPYDIEAILYCCMFHISRKAKRHRQLKFNSLILSNFALFSLLNNIDFYQIKERVLKNDEFTRKDLYHLRILNSLTVCHLEYSLLYGSLTLQDDYIREFNNLIKRFPQINVGDKIKLSEINLADIVINIFRDFKQYFKTMLDNCLNDPSYADNDSNVVIFPEFHYWLSNWEDLLTIEGGGLLFFTYHFYQIMICRTFINEFLVDLKLQPTFLNMILRTMKEHSFSLLNEFLKLSPTLIKGAPILTTNQLVYTCLTLCDYLQWFNINEKQQILSICTRVYWHLNTIGEKLNEMTENMAKIIKSIINTGKSRVTQSLPPSSLVNNSIQLDNLSKSNINEQIASPSPALSETLSVSSIGLNSLNNNRSNTNLNSTAFLPDVDRFNTFEEFFQEFFDHLKPTTKKMFS